MQQSISKQNQPDQTNKKNMKTNKKLFSDLKLNFYNKNNSHLDHLLHQARDFADLVGHDLEAGDWPLLVDPFVPLQLQSSPSVDSDAKLTVAESKQSTYLTYDYFGLVEAEGWLQMFSPNIGTTGTKQTNDAKQAKAKTNGGMIDLGTFVTSLRSLRAGYRPVYHKNNSGGSLFRQGGTFIINQSSDAAQTARDGLGTNFLYAHVDFTTGGGPSLDELIDVVKALEL